MSEIDLAALLEYQRDRVAAGELWRLVTGQLVHWSPAMRTADVGVILVAGWLVAQRSLRLLAICVVVSIAAVGVAVHLFAPHLTTYRGSSGVAAALVVTCALELTRSRGLRRRVALTSLLVVAVKLMFELATGRSMLPGTLPPDVVLAPAAHVGGAVSAVSVWLAVRMRPNATVAARMSAA